MLPSSEMLNAAERGIKQIRSVTDQLGQDLDYTNQEVSNFINGLKNGANEAVKLPTIFNKVAQSLEVINKNFDEATAKAQTASGVGSVAGGALGATTPIPRPYRSTPETRCARTETNYSVPLTFASRQIYRATTPVVKTGLGS